jgi:hypothetical protein
MEDTTNKHLKMTPMTATVHMNQKSQIIRSTSKEIKVTSDLEDEVVTPGSPGEKKKFGLRSGH